MQLKKPTSPREADQISFPAAESPSPTCPSPALPPAADGCCSLTTTPCRRRRHRESQADHLRRLRAVRGRARRNRQSRRPGRRYPSISDFAVQPALCVTGNNLVIGAVQRGTNQVVHRGIDHQKSLAVIFFAVDHGREQNARRADDRAAGLEQQAAHPSLARVAASVRA